MSSKKVILRHPRMRSLLRFSTLKRDKLESSANLQGDQKRKSLFWVSTLLLRRLKKKRAELNKLPVELLFDFAPCHGHEQGPTRDQVGTVWTKRNKL